MKLPNSISHESSQYHTSVLIDFAANLNFVSRIFLTRNNILGKCTRGPKIDVRVLNEQRISTSKTYVPTNVSLLHMQHCSIMDPNQPKPLMKLPISIRQDSSLYRTSVLIDSAESLNFVSQVFLTRIIFWGNALVVQRSMFEF